MGKPVLDMLIFTAQLASSLGPVGTTGLVGQYYITAWILKKATPAFGRMAATEARLEGEYRTDLGRIGRDSEEIAYVRVCISTTNVLTASTMAASASTESCGRLIRSSPVTSTPCTK